MLNGLDLFSGGGGLADALSPWVRPLCYVEVDRYKQAVLMSRMRAGQIGQAPIWCDIRAFNPRPFAGSVDIVYGGFPCQDISTAGRRVGLGGKRSRLFWHILRITAVVRPDYIFLENVPAITAPAGGGYVVARALAAHGYLPRWGVLSAYDVGAPHLRERWWCLAANADRFPTGQPGRSGGESGACPTVLTEHGTECSLAHAEGERCEEDGRLRCGELTQRPAGRRADVADAQGRGFTADGRAPGRAGHPDQRRADVANSASPQLENAGTRHARAGRTAWGFGSGGMGIAAPDSCGAGSSEWNGCAAEAGPCSATPGGDWWAVEPDVGRVVDGMDFRVNRIGCLGDGVVPACAREAFRRLMWGW